jgi:hypothetical protein
MRYSRCALQWAATEMGAFKNNNYDFQTKDISVLLTTRSRQN